MARRRWCVENLSESLREKRDTVVTADDSQEQVATLEIGPAEQSLIRASIATTWVKTLQAAEAMHICLHPSYVRHSEPELTALVEQALNHRRGPSQMVAELLAGGSRSLARKAAEV